MELETIILIEEEMYIIGEYGLEAHPLKVIPLPLDTSIVSLEHSLFQFGKPFARLLIRRIVIMIHRFFYLMKDTIVNFQL